MSQKDFLEICEEALKAPEVNLQAFRKARDAFEKDKEATAIKKTAATTSITPKDPKQVRGAEYFNDNGEKKNAS